jgi:hypothetical protein
VQQHSYGERSISWSGRKPARPDRTTKELVLFSRRNIPKRMKDILNF